MSTLEQDINNSPGLIVYDISNVKFCTDITKINFILKLREIKIPPNYFNDPFTEITLEKGTYPFVNLQNILKLKKTQPVESNRLLLYDSDKTKFFFLVDKIFHIVTINSNFRNMPIIEKPSLRGEFIKGAINFEDSEQYIIDMEKIGNLFPTGTNVAGREE